VPGTRAWRIAAVALVVAAATSGLWLLASNEPEPLRDIRRAQAAGDSAADRAEEVLANLEALTSNLERGEGLGTKTAEIRELTKKQRASLQTLADVLRGQITAIRRSVAGIEGTERSTAAVAELSARQAAAIRRSVVALERLRAAARRSGAASADFALRAAYAAKLAEDSSEAFSSDA
jgi:hypothetical protein